MLLYAFDLLCFGYNNKDKMSYVNKSNRNNSSEMNGNYGHSNYNFGGGFVRCPPPQSYQQYNNNKSNMTNGMYWNHGINPIHGGFHHNSNKTFSTCSSNMNGSGYRNGHNQQQQQQQQQHIHNFHPPPVQNHQYPMNASNQNNPANNSGFINGIKNIVNNIIHPKCDFSFDHNRHYNSNYQNNFKLNQQQNIPKRTAMPCPKEYLKSVFKIGQCSAPNPNHMRTTATIITTATIPTTPATSTMTSSPVTKLTSSIIPSSFQFPCQKQSQTPKTSCSSSETQSGDNNNRRNTNCKPASPPEIVAIFTSEDFPELPKPKKQTVWKHNPQEKCSYFKNNSTTPTAKKISKEISITQALPIVGERIKPVSECDSEDSFIVFTNESPSTVKIPIPPTTISITPPTKFHSGLLPFRQRQRQISECSDDSFVICFQDEGGNGSSDFIEFSDISDDSDTDEEDLDEFDGIYYDDDDSDDADDDNDNNDDRTLKNDRTCDCETASCETSQPDSGFDDQKDKKVRFDLKPVVHVMHSWDFAYRAARKGPWEQIARDRCRFKQRIEKLNEIICPILSKCHRQNIYKTRFCDKNESHFLDQV